MLPLMKVSLCYFAGSEDAPGSEPTEPMTECIVTPNFASPVDSKLQQQAWITCEMEIHLLHGDDLCSAHHIG